MTDKDFGFSKVDWSKVSTENVKLALSSYEERHSDTIIDYNDLESKARWQFAIVSPIAFALTVYLIANWRTIPYCGGLSFLVLCTLMWLGLLFLYHSMQSREYIGKGMTPKGRDISLWNTFLLSKDEENTFYGMRIRDLSEAISSNSKSNQEKSKWLGWASLINLWSLPITSLIVILCLILVDSFGFGTVCPVTT